MSWTRTGKLSNFSKKWLGLKTSARVLDGYKEANKLGTVTNLQSNPTRGQVTA
jgi:hypothetical protein